MRWCRPTECYMAFSPLGLYSRVRAHFKEEELLCHGTLYFFLISIQYFIKLRSNLSKKNSKFRQFFRLSTSI